MANNQFAYSTPNTRQFACAGLAAKAAGYGVAAIPATAPTWPIASTMLAAVAAARAGDGPQLVVACLLRLCGHGEHDDAFYITDAIAPPASATTASTGPRHRPRPRLGRRARPRRRSEVQEIVRAAVARAQQEAVPDPFPETWPALSSTPA